MSILGTRVVRREDPALLTSGGTYLDDLQDPLLEGALHVAYVRSPSAHATITSVEVEDAAAAPGVVAVFTAADVDLGTVPLAVPMIDAAMARPYLAEGVVRFVGEPIAVVLAETAAQAEDAVQLVWADLEPLPAIIDPEQSRTSETVLFPAAGSNVVVDLAFGRTDGLFDGCDTVVRQRMVNQRVAACPLEGRAGASAWSPDGRLHHWASTQHAHSVRDALLSVYALDDGSVRVVTPDVGGGFGAKGSNYPEELLLPWLARRAGRPVRWVENRSENMVGMGHGRAQIQQVEMGGSADGRIEAYRLTVLQDSGAYPEVGSALPYLTRMMASGVYDIANVECESTSVVTNTTPIVAYRGAGRPEATSAIERAVDLFATELGLDPAEVRYRNLVADERFPFTNPTGTTYDVGAYAEALTRALGAAGYEGLRTEQRRRREAGDRVALGIGLSVYVEVTAGPFAGSEFARVEMRPGGGATVFTGTSPHGQGHATAWAMIASDELGIGQDLIDVVHGDTDLVPTGGGTMGSRSLQLGGSAVLTASRKVVDQARTIAAALLEAEPDDVVLDPSSGSFHVAGVPSVSQSWAEVVLAAGDEGLAANTDFTASAPTFPFGAHVAVVEVDTETGMVRLARLVAVDDAGRVLNPLLVEGQRHGGIAQGVAQALFEEVLYDEDGNPITSTFAEYGFPSAAEFPLFELIDQETPTPINPLGAKGIGESGTIGSTAAVQNAVVDALAHLGVRHLDMPATPERVWRAVAAAAGDRTTETS